MIRIIEIWILKHFLFKNIFSNLRSLQKSESKLWSYLLTSFLIISILDQIIIANTSNSSLRIKHHGTLIIVRKLRERQPHNVSRVKWVEESWIWEGRFTGVGPLFSSYLMNFFLLKLRIPSFFWFRLRKSFFSFLFPPEDGAVFPVVPHNSLGSWSIDFQHSGCSVDGHPFINNHRNELSSFLSKK